jgi:hypothetical protein
MDTKFKKSIVMQNNYICKFGYLQNKTTYTSVKNHFNEEYNVGIPIKFCDVYILKIHPLIIAKQFFNCNLNPVIINVVNEKYTDHNIENLEGVYDEILNLRTNFQTISRQNNNFPPKENEVIYTPQVIVMRDEMLNQTQNFFKVSFITITSKLEECQILSYNETETDSNTDSNTDTDNEKSQLEVKNVRIFSAETYLLFKTKIEVIFQTAHYAGNQVVIFNDFGCIQDNLPVDDFIDIMNSCILKYGHLFKEIIFAIPVRTPKEQLLYEQFMEKMIKPQNIICEDNEDDKQQDQLLANIIMHQTN